MLREFKTQFVWICKIHASPIFVEQKSEDLHRDLDALNCENARTDSALAHFPWSRKV